MSIRSRKKSLEDRLWRAILLGVILCIGVACDRPASAQDASIPTISFSTADAIRLLDEIEQCRAQSEEIVVLRALNEKSNELDSIREEREKLLRDRVEFLEKQNEEWARMNEQAIKTAEQIRKTSGGTWYERAFEAGKWIGLGVLVGVAIGF